MTPAWHIEESKSRFRKTEAAPYLLDPYAAAWRTAATAPVIVVNGERLEAAERTDYVADADIVLVQIANADTVRAEGVAITFRTFS